MKFFNIRASWKEESEESEERESDDLTSWFQTAEKLSLASPHISFRISFTQRVTESCDCMEWEWGASDPVGFSKHFQSEHVWWSNTTLCILNGEWEDPVVSNTTLCISEWTEPVKEPPPPTATVVSKPLRRSARLAAKHC